MVWLSKVQPGCLDKLFQSQHRKGRAAWHGARGVLHVNNIYLFIVLCLFYFCTAFLTLPLLLFFCFCFQIAALFLQIVLIFFFFIFIFCFIPVVKINMSLLRWRKGPPPPPPPLSTSSCLMKRQCVCVFARVGWCTWAQQRPHLHSKAINSSIRLLGSLKNIQAPALTRWLLYWYWSGQSVRALVHPSRWVVVICACNRGGRRKKPLLYSSKTKKKNFNTLYLNKVCPCIL